MIFACKRKGYKQVGENKLCFITGIKTATGIDYNFNHRGCLKKLCYIYRYYEIWDKISQYLVQKPLIKNKMPVEIEVSIATGILIVDLSKLMIIFNISNHFSKITSITYLSVLLSAQL